MSVNILCGEEWALTALGQNAGRRLSLRGSEDCVMRKFLCGLAALPFLATTALAGQPLSDRQMDAVVAAFSSLRH
jgi:hypothetical protein